MRVDEIRLEHFRNYALADAAFEPGINVISGANAQGKTNLLEAVYLLTGGKSFRTRFDRDIISFDSGYSKIDASINASGRGQTVSILLRRGVKKNITQNGVKKTASELGEALTAVLFCPEDLSLIKSGAQSRRRLMDMAISQLRPGYARLLGEYSRLYDHKTRILRDYREKPSLLDTLDEFSDAMCRVSAQLIRYRASFALKLMEHSGPIHSEFSGGSEELSIRYKTVSAVDDPSAGASEIYAQVSDHQRAHREAELSAGMCLTGAHKDDLEIEINGRSAKSFASQGQTRTAALSVKLGEREIFAAETGEYPVLLLDDVLSELDVKRQRFVLNRIVTGQTLITSCGDDFISRRTGGRVIIVENGSISTAGG